MKVLPAKAGVIPLYVFVATPQSRAPREGGVIPVWNAIKSVTTSAPRESGGNPTEPLLKW